MTRILPFPVRDERWLAEIRRCCFDHRWRDLGVALRRGPPVPKYTEGEEPFDPSPTVEPLAGGSAPRSPEQRRTRTEVQDDR